VRLWKVVVLVNVALALGVGGGYLRWGREVRRLEAELEAARRASVGPSGSEATWTVHGIVRSVLPSLGAIVLTHETMPGLMQAMTMGFETTDPRLLDGLSPGDRVRFTVKRAGDRILLVAIEKAS
jgi:Cu/Ag efflux protein CusF